jgi:hypothetical protein
VSVRLGLAPTPPTWIDVPSLQELVMHLTSSWAVDKLAHAVHLNAARDADFDRRDKSRAAVDAWRRARSAGERASAADLVIRAAQRYGLPPIVPRC